MDKLDVIDDGLDRRCLNAPQNETLSIEPVPRIEERLTELGASVFDTAAILPRNFDSAVSLDDCVFESITADLVTLGKRAGLELSTLGMENRKTINEHDIATIGATIVLVLEHAEKIAAFVEFFNLVAKYLKRRGHGEVNDQTEVIQEVIVTDRSITRRITYRGPLSGLSTIVAAAQEALNAPINQAD